MRAISKLRSPRFPLAATTLALLVTLLGSPQPALATFPGKNGLIAFDQRFCCVDTEEVHTAYALDARGRRHELLDDYWTPSFSADGWRLAFVGSALQWAPINGLRVGHISSPGEVADAFDPVWSPNGADLAYEAGALYCGPQSRIETIAVGGAAMPQQLALGGDPAWSVKGRIAFVRATGRRPGNLCAKRLSIYVMDGDGGHLRQITKGSQDREPDWSPNGRGIVFARVSRAGGIFVATAASGRPRRLTTSSEGTDRDPTWSPDGKKILFIRGADLWLMNSRGGDRRLIARHTASPKGGGSYEMYSTAWQPRPNVGSSSARRLLGAAAALSIWSLAPAASALGPVTFAPAADYPAPTAPEPVAIGDLNGGGRLDLAVANPGSTTGLGSSGVSVPGAHGASPKALAMLAAPAAPPRAGSPRRSSVVRSSE